MTSEDTIVVEEKPFVNFSLELSSLGLVDNINHSKFSFTHECFTAGQSFFCVNVILLKKRKLRLFVTLKRSIKYLSLYLCIPPYV